MNLNQRIFTILKKKKLKISFAESCTGGLLSSAITSVEGSSKIFSMGLITYSNQKPAEPAVVQAKYELNKAFLPWSALAQRVGGKGNMYLIHAGSVMGKAR